MQIKTINWTIVFGTVVLLGGLIFFFVHPGPSAEIKCGNEVMKPGTHQVCVTDGDSGSGQTYDEMREIEDSGSTYEFYAIAAMLFGGGFVIVEMVKSRRQRVAAARDGHGLGGGYQ